MWPSLMHNICFSIYDGCTELSTLVSLIDAQALNLATHQINILAQNIVDICLSLGTKSRLMNLLNGFL